MADVTLDHRYPKIRLPRNQAVGPGTLVALYWSGKRAPNNDGVPTESGINYDAPLAVSRMWSKGHRELFGGRFGYGGFGFRHASINPAMGFAKGPFAGGGFAVGGGVWTWTSPFPWRDGTYSVAIRLGDRLGNENATPAAILSIEIAALPRPVPRAWIAAFGGAEDDWNVRIVWRHSPEFAPTE